MVELRILAREMFYAVNNGTVRSQILQFLRVRHELLMHESVEEIKGDRVRKILLDSISNGTRITVYHPKCMRFCYPNGDSLQIVDHTGDYRITTKDGNEYLLPGEEGYLYQLMEMKKVLEANGVNIDFVVLVMDQDLYNCFPRDGGGIVSEQNLAQAEVDSKTYYLKLKEILKAKGISVFTQTEYMESMGLLDEYLKKKNQRMGLLRKGGLIKESFVEERVNYFYESKKRIFKNYPDREFARSRVILEIASMLSLDILSDTGENSILLAENIYSMKGLIANGSMPTIFIDLSS